MICFLIQRNNIPTEIYFPIQEPGFQKYQESLLTFLFCFKFVWKFCLFSPFLVFTYFCIRLETPNNFVASRVYEEVFKLKMQIFSNLAEIFPMNWSVYRVYYKKVSDQKWFLSTKVVKSDSKISNLQLFPKT